jgi:hypothetical protein
MNHIVEIKSIKGLKELSAVGGGAVQGHVNPKKNLDEEDLEEDEMREEIIIERKLRSHIRNRLKSIISEQKRVQLQEEQALRKVIRQILKEGDISDIHPHRSTGINVLEDLLKKMIPTLRTDYKRLTSDESQRQSFRAHLIKAIKDSLVPSQVNDKYGSAGGGAEGALLSSPEPEDDGSDEEDLMSALEEAVRDALSEVEVEITDETEPGDEDKKIPVEDDDTPSEEEAFGSGLEGMDETGRNMAFTCFKKVQQYILDSYDSLANPEDKKIFVDYLITNVKLYFDKFEDELQKTVEEPTTDEYEQAKSGEL